MVIGADQIAVFDGKILGKPGTKDRAGRQLAEFAGNRVTFMTHCTVTAAGGRSQWHHTDTTQVYFRPLGDAEIRAYVDKERPLDCAGGFKIEQLGISLFERVQSDDPSALIGLPLIFVARALRHYGFQLP